MRTHRTITSSILAVGASALLAACGSSSSAGTGSSPRAAAPGPAKAPVTRAVHTTLTEWKIAASSPRAVHGKVSFTAKNAGQAPHELIVIRTSKAAGDLGTGARVSEAGSVGEASDIAPGATKSVTVALKPGHYALICNLPGHYKLGMHADLVVK